MKVNFDQLFVDEPVNSVDPLLAQSTIQSTERKKSVQLNDTVQTQEQTNYQQYQQPSIVEQHESIRQILQFKLALALQQEQLKQRAPDYIKTLVAPSVDVDEVTQRLYNHKPCDHRCCFDYKIEKQIKQQAQQLWIKQHNSKYKTNNTKKTIQDQSALSERLHNHSNYKNIKLLELKLRGQKQYKQKNVRKKYSNNQKYLNNYVPFYQRLDSEVRKSREKLKLYQINPFCAQQQSQPYFMPAKLSHKYLEVESRYKRQPSQYYDRLSYLDDFSYSSMNTSSLSVLSLDRSIELVNSLEEYFIQKMKCIFIQKDKDIIQINQEQISLLSEIEFKIMQQFIMKIQQDEMHKNKFQTQLRRYLQNLDFRDKQELRTHQTKTRKAIMRKQRALKQQQLQTTKSSVSTKVKSSRPNHYLRKFENYA